VEYCDPFAGRVAYEMDAKTRFRIGQLKLDCFVPIRERFLERGQWPSSASAAQAVLGGIVQVFDADEGRRNEWAESASAEVMAGESGWKIVADRETSARCVWLIDPYDFVAEWRDQLPAVLDKAKQSSVLLYVYNRSARSPEAFAEYRAMRNKLADGRIGQAARLGRVAGDAFLPTSHHELFFLPGKDDAANPEIETLYRRLEHQALTLAGAVADAAAFDAI
ncbi:MAG: hypothetical protein LIP23_10110, partial [Planctomycetes bacterium]|nr:hypothetical protein [Planctomycetota bacterium]